MKNPVTIVFLFILLAGLGLAQHEAPSEAAHETGDPMLLWKWVNFGILAIGLGYLVAKNLPAFFASRTEEIQKGITEAAKLKADADAQYAAMEARMAKLDAEIEALRTQGKSEMAEEGARIRKESKELVAKLQAGAEAEIESSAKSARQELKAYAANLAVDIAERRIRSRSGYDGSEARLVERFIHDLERKGANN